MQSLEQRRETTEAQGNWAEAAEYTRFMAEIQNLMDIAQQMAIRARDVTLFATVYMAEMMKNG